MYVVMMKIGTPHQAVYSHLGTGSSDMYVKETDSAYCESLADENDIWTSDYERTTTATEIRAATSFKDYNTSSSYWGTFSPKSSFTFKNNETFFNEISVMARIIQELM